MEFKPNISIMTALGVLTPGVVYDNKDKRFSFPDEAIKNWVTAGVAKEVNVKKDDEPQGDSDGS